MSSKDRPRTSPAEHTRLQKALRESVILRELADILNSSLDLEHILQALVKRTTELCEVMRCAVWLLEESGDKFRPITYYVADPVLAQEMMRSADAIWHRSPLPIDNPVIRRLLSESETLFIEDLRTEPSVQTFAETFQVQSVLLIALTREGRPVGMLSLDNPGHFHPFTKEQQQLARAIGQQATVAIDNARLYQQAQAQQRRAEHLIDRARAVYQVAMRVNSGEELPIVLELATRHLIRALEASDGIAMLLEGDETTLQPVGPMHQKMSDHFAAIGLSLDRLPSFWHAIHTGKTILITAEHAREQEIEWFRRFGLKSILLVPLMGGTPHQGANWDLPGEPREVVLEDGEEAQPMEAYCPGLIVIQYTRRRKPTPGEYAFAQDIAAQCALAIEKALLLSEARRAADLATERASTLDAVFQAMTEGITVATSDEKIYIRNHAAASFLGVPVYSSSSIDTFLQNHPAYTLDGRLLAYEDFPITRALRGVAQVRGERVVTVRADGARRVVEFTATPLKNNDQQIGMVCAVRDVTVQVQVEQRIRQTLDTFLHIAEAVSHSTDIREILHRVLAETLTTLRCTRGTVHLFQQGSQSFDPLLSLGFSPDDETHWLQKQQTWLDQDTGEAYGFYAQIIGGHATLISEEHSPVQPNPFAGSLVLAAPITHNQQILGLILLDRSPSTTLSLQLPRPSSFTNWDITIIEGIAQLAGVAMEQARWQQEASDARASEAVMREADAMKNEFLAITAHEFRNPLTVILARSQGALRSLQRASKSEASPSHFTSIEEHLDTIAGQARQLNNIVTTFLDAARINQGQITLKMEAIDLGKIARQIAEDQDGLAENHTVRCAMNEAQGPFLVKGDQARLAQIIANLVENAIKYSPFGGPVTIHLRRLLEDEAPELIEISVEDKGMGIPPEAQSRLFERFYRVPHAAHGETRGIGLGLYIVAQLLKRHGGHIRVTSSGVLGKGSCFIFTLPALPVPIEDEHPGT